jgi:hypothetical protein
MKVNIPRRGSGTLNRLSMRRRLSDLFPELGRKRRGNHFTAIIVNAGVKVTIPTDQNKQSPLLDIPGL